MAELPKFDIEVRIDPQGTPVSPRVRVGALADRRASYAVDLVPSGRADRIDVHVEKSRWRLDVPAEAEAELSFRRSRGEPVMRLRAVVALGVALRAPGRRGAEDLFAGKLQARHEAELTVDLPAPEGWTLARAARELAGWLDPRGWSGSRRPPQGAVWRIDGETPLELAGSARVRRVLTSSLGAAEPFADIPAAAEIEARIARTERVRTELRVLDGRVLRARVSTLDRGRRELAAEAELGWSLREPAALRQALLEAIGPEVAEAARDLHALLDDVRSVQRHLEELPEEIRRLGGRAIGPGSRLERLELRLEEIQALLEAVGDDGSGPAAELVRELREAVASIRRRGGAWIERVAVLAEELDPDDRLPRFAAGLARVLDRLGRLEQSLLDAAGEVIAEGITVDLAASHRRTRERRRLAEVRLSPGASHAAERAIALTLAGRLADLRELSGEPGILRVGGSVVTSAKRRRRRALRVRLGTLGIDRSAVWKGELRVERSLDGAVELRVRERLERERRRLAHGDVAALLVDLVLAGELGELDPSLTLRWSQSWRGRRTRRRAAAMLERTIEALELDIDPVELPEDPGELVVRSRLTGEAIEAALRSDEPARRFADGAFWPAWAAAVESGYRLVPPPILRPGRHPLRSRRIRAALRRAPFARTVAEVLPGTPRLESESIAADWRVGRALLEALQAARRAARRPDPLSPRTLASLSRDVVGALRHAGAIDLVPLIALTALVPADLRRVQVSLEPE